MESGLSDRMENVLNELQTKSANLVPTKRFDPTETINLSSAQNEVLRPELVEFFKTAVEDKLTGEVRKRFHGKHVTKDVGIRPCTL
jgi:hypothetical protein